MNDNTQALRAGSRLQGGRYTIEKTLGEGGFGITYLAVQAGLNRDVAVKEFFMRQFCERDSTTSAVTVGSAGSRDLVATARGKFVKEAQTIAGLDNNHIIRIHDIFEENGTAYYVMEHIPGGSLEDLVKRRGVLPEEEAVGYARQIADALGYIHGKNILHLDIKPSNILFRKDGEIVLIDFGVSKRYDEEGEEISGTPVARSRGYAPIEQYRQGGTRHFDRRIDIYSLGAVLYFMLVGKRPPEATDLVTEPLTFPSHVSDAMRGVILKSMSADKGHRPQSAAEFASLLGDETVIDAPEPPSSPEPDGGKLAVVAEGGMARKTGEKEPSKPRGNGSRKTIAIVAAAFVACAVVAFLLRGSMGREEPASGLVEAGQAADTVDSAKAQPVPIVGQPAAPKEGMLSVDFKPVGTEVWIDGGKAGVTGKVAREFGPLAAGGHKVELRKSGYVTVTYKELLITAGDTREIKGELEEEAEASSSAMAQASSSSSSSSSSSTSTSSSTSSTAANTNTATTGVISGHAYVDLGLSVKWATCNVGASKPSDYGNYYAWGETKTKSIYDEDNCETWEKSIGDIGGTDRDVAHVKWGGTWRMPTLDEIKELIDNCTWTWTTLNGANGYKVTSRKNGNSIFLPAAGWWTGTSLDYAGGSGRYWSSTPDESHTQGAYHLGLYSGYRGRGWCSRAPGHSVRPVSE